MSEFGGASRAGKSVRVGLGPLCEVFGDGRLPARLTKICRHLVGLAPGEKGQRPILFSRFGRALEGLALRDGNRLFGRFKVPFSVEKDADGVHCLRVEPFSPSAGLVAPQGSTHFQVVFHTTLLSDVHFDPVTGEYCSLHPAFSGKSSTVVSPALPLAAKEVHGLELASGLGPIPDGLMGLSVMTAVGIIFMQEVNSEMHPLRTGACLEIVGVEAVFEGEPIAVGLEAIGESGDEEKGFKAMWEAVLSVAEPPG